MPFLRGWITAKPRVAFRFCLARASTLVPRSVPSFDFQNFLSALPSPLVTSFPVIVGNDRVNYFLRSRGAPSSGHGSFLFREIYRARYIDREPCSTFWLRLIMLIMLFAAWRDNENGRNTTRGTLARCVSSR